ncbi:MAG: hypothetical protein ACO26C_01660 [Ilumatobacteraceae bacterium]
MPTPAPAFPVPDDLRDAVGLVDLPRGRTLHCAGDACLSLALSLVAPAPRLGAWLAVVGIPALGAQAAAEQGVALERTVFVHPPAGGTEWAASLAALVEGFDVALVGAAPSLPATLVRRLQARVQARRALLVLVDVAAAWPGARPAAPWAPPDLALRATTRAWEGLEHGAGHLRRRQIAVRVDGRRAGPPREHLLWRPA